MKIQKTSITDLIILQPDVFADERGYFQETYNQTKYRELGLPDFVQDNESMSQKGVLRGLHLQLPPHGQGKLVRVITGEVLDVAVDCRPNSPTVGQHFSIILNGENKTQFYIPPGFAHGFAVLSEKAIFSYKCTAFWNKEAERGIVFNDQDLNIDWKIDNPILSGKDRKNRSFKQLMEEVGL
ncbi:MAG: dTDP-4-dehydrorhamnose 3,5-epimerase [Patescibacteria group bacterium]